MASQLGRTLPRKPVAWFWFAVAALPCAYFGWRALAADGSWVLPAVLAVIAGLIAIEPRLRKPATETIQIDDSGVLRVEGAIREQISWNEVHEIRIITTDEGPYREDVFFVLISADGKGCLVPHDAAVRTKLLEELQSRFANLDDDAVIRAMGSTSNNNFLIWKAGGVTA